MRPGAHLVGRGVPQRHQNCVLRRSPTRLSGVEVSIEPRVEDGANNETRPPWAGEEPQFWTEFLREPDGTWQAAREFKDVWEVWAAYRPCGNGDSCASDRRHRYPLVGSTVTLRRSAAVLREITTEGGDTETIEHVVAEPRDATVADVAYDAHLAVVECDDLVLRVDIEDDVQF